MKTSPRLPRPGPTRRHFMRASAAVGTGVLMAGQARAAGNSLEGYVGSPSVRAGGTIDFFLRDPQALGTGTTDYSFTITRVGAPDVFMSNVTVAIGNQVVPADAATQGCRWVRTYRLTVPAAWPSGLYYAYVGSGENATTVPFIVRPVAATTGVKRVVSIPVTTVHAYNEYGGKSLYDYNSSGGVRASQVSLDRPLTQTFNSFYDVYSQYLVRWLSKNNIAADFCTDLDIEAEPALLDAYQLYMQAGHDEYWTRARRLTMDAFVARGGNAMYLAGNTAWFQIRLEPNASGGARRTMVCYKDAAADPVADPLLKTINFAFLATPYPENATTGLGFVKGCSWAGSLPRPITPTVVQRAEHWAFAGTGLAQGAGFGGAYVGYESDSADFTVGSADQRAFATGLDGSPATLRILGVADATNWNAQSIALGGGGELSGHAMISVFSRGGSAGTVFNGGSTDWAYGLRPEIDGQTPTPISRITRNAIDKLSEPWTESCDVRQYRSSIGTLANYYFGIATTAPAGSTLALDGLAFRALAVAGTGTVPVYRFRSTATDPAQRNYLLSTSAAVPGGAGQYVADGVAFHAFASAVAGSTPVYEHVAFNATLGRNVAVYSTSAAPPAGYSAGAVRFHAPGEGSGGGTAPPPPPAPGFTLSAASTALAVVRGQSTSTAISVNRLNGFAGTVVFAASGLPAGVTASFSPGSSGTGSTVTLATTAAVAAGNYSITVVGTAAASGNTPAITATVVLTLAVTAAAQSFTLQPGSTSVLMLLGGLFAQTVSVRVAGANGFNSPVTFSVSGLPARMAASFQPASSATGTVMRLAATSILGAQRGTFTLTVRGTAGSLVATTTIRLTVL